MTCRSCGATIADKAIVCYRCGTPTATSVPKPSPVRGGRSWAAWLIVLVIVLLAVLAVLFLHR